jgi:hypothetical protein
VRGILFSLHPTRDNEDEMLPRPHYVGQTTTNSVAFCPQSKYTDSAAATCRRNLVPTFVDRGMSLGQRSRSPTVVNLSFLDRSRYFFFQVFPHLSSQVLSGPRSRPGASGLTARNFDHQTTEAVSIRGTVYQIAKAKNVFTTSSKSISPMP